LTNYDFNSSRAQRDAFNEAMTDLLDRASKRLWGNEAPRAYNISPSMIGDECLRRVQFMTTKAPSKPHEGKLLRIFQRGHIFEPFVLAILREAGFDISEVSEDGAQHGFQIMDNQCRGRLDGKILSGPEIEGLIYPCPWECKVLGDKGFKAAVKDGIAKAHPKYAVQAAMYQAYGVEGPMLFSVLNANTMEIYSEAFELNEERCQDASDRAVMILRANRAGELLPRAAGDPDQFPCKWCDFSEHCWNEGGLGPQRKGENAK